MCETGFSTRGSARGVAGRARDLLGGCIVSEGIGVPGGFFFSSGQRQGRGEGGEAAVGADLEVGGVADFRFADGVHDGGVVDPGTGRQAEAAELRHLGGFCGCGVEVATGVNRDADRAGEVGGAEGSEVFFAQGAELRELASFVDDYITTRGRVGGDAGGGAFVKGPFEFSGGVVGADSAADEGELGDVEVAGGIDGDAGRKSADAEILDRFGSGFAVKAEDSKTLTVPLNSSAT